MNDRPAVYRMPTGIAAACRGSHQSLLPTVPVLTMKDWQQALQTQLAGLDALRLRRSLLPMRSEGPLLVREGRSLINLGSNDYLGLSQDQALKSAAIDAIEQFGTGAGASRLVCGHSEVHAQVEARFATFKHAEAALILPSGYTANMAILTALAHAGDLICLDKLCHASLIDAARASGATLRVFPHLHYSKLARLLRAAAPGGRRFRIVSIVSVVAGAPQEIPRQSWKSGMPSI